MKKKLFFRVGIIAILTLMMLTPLANSQINQGNQEYNDVYVIPISGDIYRSTYQFVKRTVDEIAPLRPAAIIFEIDTYGGLINEANNIKDVIVGIEVPTIAFVNNKAESAGVLITIANERIAMADRATIGSAETIPNTEKVMSLWLSWLRDTARFRGRDSELVQSMADRTIEIPGVVEQGRLLNLSAQEAIDLEFIDLVANDYESILRNFDIQYNRIKVVEMDLRTNIARVLTNPYIMTLLLALGFIGIIIEVLTPGFGAGGTVSLISFALFFGGNILAGNSTWGAIIIFIAGLLLVAIELVVPGFGIPGIGGIVAMFISIVLAMGSLERALVSILIALGLTAIAGFILIKYGYKNPYVDKIILSTKQENKEGYTSTLDKRGLLDATGIALTDLRPAGTIEVGDIRLDAVTEGQFIGRGSSIKIVKIEGYRVVVREYSSKQ